MAIKRTGISLDDVNELNGGNRGNSSKVQDAFDDREIPSPRQRTSVIGLAMGDDYLMGKNKDSEILELFSEVGAKVLASSQFDIKVFKIDLDKFGLGFSHSMYAFKGDNGSVYYFSALLEATGRAPLNVSDIVRSLDNKMSSDVLLSSDAFDSDYYDEIEKVLTKTFHVDVEDIVFCQGVVIPAGDSPEVTAEVIARYAQDAIVTKYLIDSNTEPDINVDAINDYNTNGSLNLELAINSGASINMVGRVVKSDFNLEVTMVKNGQTRSLNNQSGRKRLTTTSGYVDFIISEVPDQRRGGLIRMAQPMFVLNEFIGIAPSLNYALLSIINASTFSNINVLRSMIIEKDAGPLNYLFNYGNDGSKYGDVISFKDDAATPEQIEDIMRAHFIENPIIALDIEEFGTDYTYMLGFAALSSPRDRAAANDYILGCASELVGAKLDAKSVTDMPCTYIPLGEYTDSNGDVKDLRDIDTVFIAKYANDPNILIEWILSNATPDACISATGKDPYTLKLELLDKISAMTNLNIVIKGRAVRVVLSGDFVNELTFRAMSAGYSPRTDSPNVSYNNFNNLQAIASTYSSSSISAQGFGVQNMRQGGYAPQPYFRSSVNRR